MSGDWSSDVCSSDLFPSHDTEADKKYADFMNRMEKKYGSEWESELTKDEVNEEGKLLV